MTRVMVSSKAPLGEWHAATAPLEYWLSSFHDVAKEMVLISGQSQKIVRRHMSSLEHLDKQIATTILEQFLKLPRSSNPRQTLVDFTLLDSGIQSFGAGAVAEMRALADYQALKDERRRGSQKTESILESFDRTLGKLLAVSEAITIIDRYALSELMKQRVTAAREIVEHRFAPVGIPVTIHAVNPRELPTPESIPADPRIPVGANLKINTHHMSAGKRGEAVFPHVRLWKFDLSESSVVVALDQGFDTFNPRVPGTIKDMGGLAEWKDNYADVLVTKDNKWAPMSS